MFTAAILALLLAGGAAVSLLPRQTGGPQGAVIGDHWHAAYRIEVCGKRLAPFPHVEGQIHTHGEDGQIHIHPNTQTQARENANLGAFFLSIESGIGELTTGERFLNLSDGSRYVDGDTCPGSDVPQELTVLAGEPGEESRVDGNPAAYLPQDGGSVVVRFGPPATEETANPLAEEEATPEPTPEPPPAGDG